MVTSNFWGCCQKEKWGSGRWGHWRWVVLWWGSGHATPEYDTLVYWILEAEGVWKMAATERSLWFSPILLPWIRSWDPHVRAAHLLCRGKELPYFQDRERCQAWWQCLLEKYIGKSLLHSPYTLCPIKAFLSSPLFIKPGIQTLRLNCFFRSSFLYTGCCIMKNLNKYICFSPVNLTISLVFKPSQGP